MGVADGKDRVYFKATNRALKKTERMRMILNDGMTEKDDK